MPHTRELDSLGLKHGTDKSSRHHNYLNFYERYFAPIRNDRISLLEIGVFEGASLAVWEAYFPNGAIIGADINPGAMRFARPRVCIEIIDQSNLEHLARVAVTRGPFDVIIEDGSHMWEHQITCLRTLFPFVKPGGLYIVEDLQTNFGSLAKTYRGSASISCMDYLKRLADLRVADDQLDIKAEEDAFLRTYGRAIHAMTFYRRACLIEKAAAPRPMIVAEPYIAVRQDAAAIPLVLLTHIGARGDRTSNTGCMRSLAPGQYIQGFSLTAPADLPCKLLYRARRADGEWTGWVPAGEFVGTRGQMEDLAGFSVRCDEAAAAGHDIHMVGQFVGVPDLVLADGGEDCTPAAGPAPLCGMQVILRTTTP